MLFAESQIATVVQVAMQDFLWSSARVLGQNNFLDTPSKLLGCWPPAPFLAAYGLDLPSHPPVRWSTEFAVSMISSFQDHNVEGEAGVKVHFTKVYEDMQEAFHKLEE